jgi:hypothetical protein
MRPTGHALLLGLAALVVHPPGAAAESEVWTKGSVEHDLGKRLSLSFELHLRLDADVSRVGSLMPELGLGYRVKSWLRTGGGYRLEYERDKDGVLVARHRFFGWGRLRRDLGEVRVEYRLQLQEQIRPDANPVARHVVRNRGEVSLRALERVVPAASIETQHILGEEGNAAHLGKVRLTVGAEYERGKLGFELFYRAEVAHYDPADPTVHILGTGVSVEI